MKTKFESGKMYTTRDGRKAKVYEVYEHCIHGAIIANNSRWQAVVWHPNGQRSTNSTLPQDLMLPKPEPREWAVACDRTSGRIYCVDYYDASADEYYEVIKVREVIEE